MREIIKRCKKGTNCLLFTFFSLLITTTVQAEYGLNLRQGVTDFSQEVYGLHMVIFWVCVVIAVLVFGVMIYSMFAHRKSKGVVPAKFTHSTKVEIIWTIIPILILVSMAIPATKTLMYMEAPSQLDAQGNTVPVKMDMTIKVTGFQWKWKYEYLGEGVSFLSTLKADSNAARQANPTVKIDDVDNYLLDVDKPLMLPVNTNVRILLTANDVIHSWWVPDFGWKRDAIPGYVNEAWTNVKTIGTYRGQCAELCGKDHGFMPVVVEVVSKEDYAIWLQQQKGEQPNTVATTGQTLVVADGQDTSDAPVVEAVDALVDELVDWTQADLLAKGQEVYNIECATCHQTTGVGMGDVFPALNGSAIVNGDKDEQIRTVVFGRAGTAMSAFADRLSESDIAATITYTRNAWDNTAKDTVQPKDVKKIKNS